MLVAVREPESRCGHDLLEALYRRDFFGIHLGLGTTRRLLRAMGRPERDFPAILVAGTNGKGSTSAMIASMLRASGRRVGLFTSPHLQDYRERIRVNGAAIGEDALADLARPLLPLMDRLGATFFEAATVLAFRHFADEKVDVAVVEVGLGGRLDATNVLPDPLAVITDVDYDHRDRLGSTLGEIAFEKAGIIRAGGEVVSGCRRAAVNTVVRRVARSRKAELVELDRVARYELTSVGPEGVEFDLVTDEGEYHDLKLRLLGSHQARNAVLAVLAVERFADAEGGMDPGDIARGLVRTRWPGRLQTIARRPTTLVDVAHNPHGAAALAAALDESFPRRRAVLVFGCLAGKDHRGMLRALLPRTRALVLAVPATPRNAASLELLHEDARALGIAPYHAPTVGEALRRARQIAGEDGLVLAAGSFAVAAESMASFGVGVAETL